MKFKKLLSSIIAMAMTASMAVMPMTASAENGSFNVYYIDDYDQITADEWTATQRSGDEVAGETTYSTWGTAYVTEEDGNNAIEVSGGDIWFFSSTPKTGKYTAKFDIKPVSPTGTPSVTVFSGDLIARWLETANLKLITDEEGNVNTLEFYKETMTIDPTEWISIEITRDFSASPNPVTATATQGNVTLTGTENGTATHLKSSLYAANDFGGILVDNVSVADYAEPVDDSEDEIEEGVYYKQDFNSITGDFDTWRAENMAKASATNPFVIKSAALVKDGNEQYLHLSTSDANAVKMYPLAVTPKTGKYKLEFEFKPAAVTSPGTNWNSTVMELRLGSKNNQWLDLYIGSSKGASQSTEVPVDTIWMFGEDSVAPSMTIDPTQWVKVEAVYDCETQMIEATVTQGENTLTGSKAFVNTDATSFTGTPEMKFPTYNGFAGAYFDNFKISDYVEPVEPEEPEEPDNDGYYYNEDFEGKTHDEWAAIYRKDSQVEGQVTYAWSGALETLDDGNNVLRKAGGDAFWFDSTPKTGIYKLKFDIRPAATTGAASTTVTNLDLAGSYMQSSNLSFITDADGNVNQMKFFGQTITIDPTQWVTVEVIKDFENGGGTSTATATYGDIVLSGTDTSTKVKSSFSQASGFAGVYIDNITVEDYVEPVEPFTGVLYEQNFNSITGDFNTWRAANAYTPSETNPFQMWEGGTVMVTDGDEQYVHVKSNADMYPLAVTPRTGKYKLEYEFKPASATAPGTDWANTVMRLDLGSSSNKWLDLYLGSSAGASKKEEVPVDTIWLFGQTKSMTIDPTQWLKVEAIYDCTTNMITATVTQGENSLTGSKAFVNTTTSATGDPKIVFQPISVTIDDVAYKYAGAYMDNFKISIVGEDVAPVLTANDIKIYAGDVEQASTKANVFTNKVTVHFGQEMWPDDMTAEKVYVEDEDGNKVSGEYSMEDYIMTIFFENGFSTGKTYTVVVEEGIRNIGGVMTTAEYTKSFVLESGVFAELIGITQNGEAVTTAAGLAAGQSKINISYTNTEDTTPILYVIAAYYKGGALVRSNFFKWETSKNLPMVNYGFNYTVPTIEGGFDEVQFMVWDGFSTLKPLSQPITLK